MFVFMIPMYTYAYCYIVKSRMAYIINKIKIKNYKMYDVKTIVIHANMYRSVLLLL